MARKKKHEDHINHEAWAIPYGDLITLLLAFFVVMYAISSINEGKFRVLSDSLQRGVPRHAADARPVQVGQKTRGSGADIAMTIVQQSMIDGQPRKMLEAIHVNDRRCRRRTAPYPGADAPAMRSRFRGSSGRAAAGARGRRTRAGLQALVEPTWSRCAATSSGSKSKSKTDILFASGVSQPFRQGHSRARRARGHAA
jgi:chemotaxis protein MotB